MLVLECMEIPVQVNPEATQSGEQAVLSPKSTPLSSWAPLAWISGVMLVSFYPMLERLVQQWMHDDDMGHGSPPALFRCLYLSVRRGNGRWNREGQRHRPKQRGPRSRAEVVPIQ